MAYFKYFPKLFYSISPNFENLKVVPNIFAKVKYVKDVFNNTNVYYTYDVKDGERPEDIAFKLYNNPQKHWIILLANDIIDPQYDWVLSRTQFEQYINKKYSSYNVTLEPTETYPTDYTVGEVVYQGETLDSSSASGNVVSYDSVNKVLQINFINQTIANGVSISGAASAQTHNIIGITCNNDGYNWASNTTAHYTITESRHNSYDRTTTTDKYQVSAKDYLFSTDTVFDRNTNNTYSSSYLMSDSTTLTINTTVAPTSYYDYEVELNEAKRSIKIPKVEYINIIEQQFKKLMSM